MEHRSKGIYSCLGDITLLQTQQTYQMTKSGLEYTIVSRSRQVRSSGFIANSLGDRWQRNLLDVIEDSSIDTDEFANI